MKFRTTALRLATALRAAEAGARGSGLVRVETFKEGGVSLTGSDGEYGVVVHLEASGEESGSAVIKADALASYASALEEETAIEAETEGSTLRITGGGRVYRFSIIEGGYVKLEVPEAAVSYEDAEKVFVLYNKIKHAIDPKTQLIKLSNNEGVLSMAATDTYRLACAETKGTDLGSWSVLIPSGGLQLAGRFRPEVLKIDPRGRLASFHGNGVDTIIRLGAAEFPSVESVLRDKGSIGWKLYSHDLQKALQRLGSVVGLNPLRCEIIEGEFRLSASSQDGGGVEYLNLNGEGSGNFGMAVRNLVDALQGLGDGEISMYYSAPERPIHLTHERDGVLTTCVVVPVRWS
jgi:DNA polymerase III sliding clamp (beta) subunit (PCNA family)